MSRTFDRPNKYRHFRLRASLSINSMHALQRTSYQSPTSMVALSLLQLWRSPKRRFLAVIDTIVVLAMLVSPFSGSLQPAHAFSSDSSAPSTQPLSELPPSSSALDSPLSVVTGTTQATPTSTPSASFTTVATLTSLASSTPTSYMPTDTSTFVPPSETSGIPSTTDTTTPLPSSTPPPSFTPVPTPPLTVTVGLPTPAPTLTPIPDTNYEDQAVTAAQTQLVSEVGALPALPGTITGTLVTGLAGGRVSSEDGDLTIGFMPASIEQGSSMVVQAEQVTYPPDDPRASRNGVPLAYTYVLTATDVVSGARIEHFARDIYLSFNVDAAALTAAGVEGSLTVYTYNEDIGEWERVPSFWNPQSNQLIAATSHFSTYSIGSAWNKIANYIPSVNSFEVNLQSGTASVNYPINIPAGPGGFNPQVSLSYNSGNVDRVDAAQQGSSAVGWGWSLSTNYIAASEKAFQSGGKYPWTASIVSDGMNGDLVLGKDGWWHTANESFAKIIYTEDPNHNRALDKWEAWNKAGTHYVFDIRVLSCDTQNGHNPPTPVCPGNGSADLTSYKWMLSSVTDIHGNSITYTYWYEDDQQTITDAPSTSRPTSAVYPHLVLYGGTDSTQNNKNKLRIEFSRTTRTVGGVNDISTQDQNGGVYQTQRINGLSVWRLLETGSSCPSWGCGTGDNTGYVRLRAYSFSQDESIIIDKTVSGVTFHYPHLTLNAIVPLGADDTTQLPATTFNYYNGSESFAHGDDQGHLYQAHNGYGGEVRYYYDAAGGDLWDNTDIRRVRAKRILDGTNASITPVPGQSFPWNALYSYDYRGAASNTLNVSGDASASLPFHSPDDELRGYAWVREQDPSGQSTDHYYSQDDTFKADEWRVQAGKEYTFTDSVAATPNPTSWTALNVNQSTDPQNAANPVWLLGQNGASITRKAGLSDGSDLSVRFMIKEGDGNFNYAGDYRIESPWQNGTDYFGIQIYTDTTACCGFYPGPQFAARLIWSIGGIPGTRDLNPRHASPLPHPAWYPESNIWYRLQIHTSPDGRMALEFYRDNYYTDTGSSKFQDYVMVKSGDAADSGSIPSFPAGRTWTFTHIVTHQGDHFSSLIDDYSETRTIYSQSDSVYENQTEPSQRSAALPNTSIWRVGLANNTNNMVIRYVPLAKSWNTNFNWNTWESPQSLQFKQFRRNETEFTYDNWYGLQTSQKAYGDMEVTGDERTSFTTYVNNTTAWILGKPQYSRTYQTIMSSDTESSSNLLSKSINYYDGHVSETATPTYGDLTKVTQVGVANGTLYPLITTSQQTGYDTSTGNPISSTDPNGHVTSTDFDLYYKSFPITTTYANTSKQYVRYDYSLDAVNVMTDVNGTVTRSAADVFGRPLKSWIASPSGYGSDTSPNEAYGFTDLGQSSITPPFYISYTVQLGTQAGSNQYTYGMRWFDGRGRVLQDVTPKDASNIIVTDSYYNSNSQVITSSLPYIVASSNPRIYSPPDTNKPAIQKAYDGIGRTTLTTNPDGTTIIDSYQLQITAESNETNSQIKYTQMDTLGRVIQVLSNDTSGVTPTATPLKVDYGYDPLNRLITTNRDASGANVISTIQYDALGRKSQMVDADMGTWQYGYDAAGNLTSQKDALFLQNAIAYPDHYIIFAYDTMNRITTKYYGMTHSSFGIPDVKYYYDNDLGDASTAHSWGLLRRAEVTLQGQGPSKANGHDYLYDPRGLLVSEAVTTSLTTRPYTTTYSYDTGGRLFGTTLPDPESTHEVVSSGYNTQGMGLPYWLTSNKLTGGDNPVNSASYNMRGQLTSLYQGGSSDYLATTFTYDDSTTKRGWLTGLQVTEPNNSNLNLLNLSMSYSANGNILGVSQLASGTDNPTFQNTYTYDAFDRLQSADSVCTSCTGGKLFASEAYQFDSLSRMTQRKVNTTWYQVNYNDAAHADAPTYYAQPQTSYSYDADGNQVSRTTGTNVQTRTFDPENRVTQIISDTYTTSYVYDANGARIIKGITASTGTAPGSGAGLDPGSGPGASLPAAGQTQRTLYVGSYEEELPPNLPVTWSQLVNATVTSPSNVLHKSGTNSNWDGGAISMQSIASGDGYVSMVADATNTRRMFGLGNTNQNATSTDVEYGLHLVDNGTLEVLESGTSRGSVGSYSVGDVLKVAVESGAVKYYRNSTLLYTSGVKPSYPLYLDTSLYTPGANLVGALLCAGSSCTSSRTIPPYTTYYSFGGKLIGMRRANYPSGNGQFRIVGDHLGSTTLVVDTASPPNVVQRQYSKPYGETAWQYTASSTGGASLTNIGYTGQRTDEDSTGLMFYNARVYDPVLSAFVSADTAAPNNGESKTYQRFNYALSNPVKYSDPTGHTAEDNGKCQTGDVEACKKDFEELGIQLEGDWNWGAGDDGGLWEIQAVLQAVHDLLTKAGWSYQDFQGAMGLKDGGQLIMKRINGDRPFSENVAADSGYDLLDAKRRIITFYNKAFEPVTGASKKEWARFATVHELAHIWDAANGFGLSRKFSVAMGSTQTFTIDLFFGHYRYGAGGTTTSEYGATSAREDWAESVASAVYPLVNENMHPELPRYPTTDSGGYSQGWQTRVNYVEDRFGDYRKYGTDPQN